MTWVDLRGRLSNPAGREAVALAARAMARIAAHSNHASAAPTAPRRWRLVDRLADQDIQSLLFDNRSGLTQQVLAERYGISLSSVKRLLRKY
ncbi:MAG: hypothetical protein ACRDP9_00535 [Kribbellaceae bacterium]